VSVLVITLLPPRRAFYDSTPKLISNLYAALAMLEIA
jgi:hypothetical protein